MLSLKTIGREQRRLALFSALFFQSPGLRKVWMVQMCRDAKTPDRYGCAGHCDFEQLFLMVFSHFLRGFGYGVLFSQGLSGISWIAFSSESFCLQALWDLLSEAPLQERVAT